MDFEQLSPPGGWCQLRNGHVNAELCSHSNKCLVCIQNASEFNAIFQFHVIGVCQTGSGRILLSLGFYNIYIMSVTRMSRTTPIALSRTTLTVFAPGGHKKYIRMIKVYAMCRIMPQRKLTIIKT